jgi:tRNA-splicing ligase RtcB
MIIKADSDFWRRAMQLKKQDRYRYWLSRGGGMRAEGLIFSSPELLDGVGRDVLAQVAGMASLPGIAGPALAMPDAHYGYGFPIGGVAGYDAQEGVISPGGVGYDINCGVRLLRSKLGASEIGQKRLLMLADLLQARIPAGVGSGGELKLNEKELAQLMTQGSSWFVKKGMGTEGDLEYCEDRGCLPGAGPDAVSQRARDRGARQAGSLGAGNHFLELAEVAEIFDQSAAAAFGLSPGQLVIWVHCGSRGLGHQVCDDYLRRLKACRDAVCPGDKKLISAPMQSGIGQDYLGAMNAAGNFAYGNRQVLTHLVREVFGRVFQAGPDRLGLGLVYDVTHNLARLEEHQVAGKPRLLAVHRKGATRALGPESRLLPSAYRKTGQPVLLPGDMGRASFVLKGSALAEKESLASSAHGAGRRLSRSKAKKQAKGRNLLDELARRKVLVRAASRSTLAEEMPDAYKDVIQVVEVMHQTGLAPKVARTRPIVVIKG